MTANLLDTTLELLTGLGQLRTRRMFGGVYIYCDDLFIATIHDDTLYLKANSLSAGEFIKHGLKQFSYWREGEIASLQYYEAPQEAFTNSKNMKLWANKALLAAREDATKRPRKKTTEK